MVKPYWSRSVHWYGAISRATLEFFLIQFAVVVQKPQSPSKTRTGLIADDLADAFSPGMRLVFTRNGDYPGIETIFDFNLANLDLKLADRFAQCTLRVKPRGTTG